MAQWLRQSTAVTLKIGPFLDNVDGDSEETALTLAQADFRLSKNGGNLAQKNEASSGTHDELGYYDVSVDATDTNTLGRLRVCIHKTGALSVWEDYMVVPANVWDSLFGADNLQVDTTQWLGTACAAPTVAGVPEVDVTHMAGGIQTVTDLKDFADAGYDPATNKVQGVVLVDTTTANSDMRGTDSAALASVCTEGRLAELDAANLPTDVAAIPTVTEIADQVWDEPVAGHVGASTAGKSLADVLADTNELQADDIPGTLATLDGKIDTAQTDLDTITGPDGVLVATNAIGSVQIALNAIGASELALDALNEIADAVWDEPVAGHVGAGTAGKSLADVLADTNELQTDDVPTLIAALPTAAENRAEMDSNSTQLATILGDTNMLQTDWVNGGRLDNLLDGAASAGDPWTTALPGAYGAGTAGKIVGDNLNAPVATIDTVVDAIKAVTDLLPDAGALTDLDSILSDTNELQSDWVNGGRLDLLLDAVNTTTPPTAAAVADQVWEETLADHSGTGGSTAEALNAAGAAGDPWSTQLPGAYSAGSAGKIIGDNVDAAISALPLAGDIWDELVASHTDAGSFGEDFSVVRNQLTGFGESAPTTLYAHVVALMDDSATKPTGLPGAFDPATDSLEAIRDNQVTNLGGSGFSTSTDSLEAIRNAIDDLVAPAVISSTSMSGSGYLSDSVSLIRKKINEPSVNTKYTDTDIVEFLRAAMATIMQDVTNNSDHPFLVRYDLSITTDVVDYVLPASCAQVWRVAKINSTTLIPEWEVWPDNELSFHGRGFTLEGNILHLTRKWAATETLQVLYVPNTEPEIHYGTLDINGTPAWATSTTLTLMDVPTDGGRDTRPNAYAGYLLRVLTNTANVMEERIITAYDASTRVATVSPAWSTTPAGATVTYEVVPSFSTLLKHVVVIQTALDVLNAEGNLKRAQGMMASLATHKRGLRQACESKMSRFPGHFTGDTVDNPNRWGGMAL